MFCYPENIEGEATRLFAGLRQDDFLKGLTSKQFAKKSAHFLSELNAIHAFREGNGRAQLSFFLLLADHAGYSLGLEELDPRAFLEAMVASFEGNEEPLANIIERLVGSDPAS